VSLRLRLRDTEERPLPVFWDRSVTYVPGHTFAPHSPLFKSPDLWHRIGMMKADRAEVSWDEQKKKWLIRIAVGEEVIRRHCEEEKSADQAKLRSAAAKTAIDEGYEISPADITIQPH
jgi:hypothetical protein